MIFQTVFGAVLQGKKILEDTECEMMRNGIPDSKYRPRLDVRRCCICWWRRMVFKTDFCRITWAGNAAQNQTFNFAITGAILVPDGKLIQHLG